MHKTEGADNVDNRFADGPPGTKVEQSWLNAVQDEITNIIETAGITLKIAETETGAQLLEALNATYVGPGSDVITGDLNIKIAGEFSVWTSTLPSGVAERFKIESDGGIFFSNDFTSNTGVILDCVGYVNHASNFKTTAGSAIILGKDRGEQGGTSVATIDEDILGMVVVEGVNSGLTAGGAGLIRFKQNGASGATFIPTDISFFTYDASGFTETFILHTDGKISTGEELAPDVDAGGICINHGATDGRAFTIKNSEVTHGMTSLVETDTYYAINKAITAEGGAWLRGFSEGNIGVGVVGHGGTADSTIATTSVSAVMLTAYKKSGTSVIAHAANENIVTVHNGNDARIIIKGNGDTYIGGGLSTGGEFAPDVDVGGICINQGSTDLYAFTVKSSDVTHDFTDFAETDTYCTIKKRHSTGGGVNLGGWGNGISFSGYEETPSTTSATNTEGVIHLVAYKNLLAAVDALADNENAFTIKNNNLTKVLIKGNGDTYIGGSLSTGGEFTPDVDTGGICVNHGANDGNAFNIKNSDVAHPFTSLFETDTYLSTLKSDSTNGGGRLNGLSGAVVGLEVRGYSGTASTTTSTSATGSVMLIGFKTDGGTGATTFGATENVGIISNAGTVTTIFKGNGDIYTDTDQTSGLAGTFDAEDDLQLCEALRFAITGWDKDVIAEYKDKLQELGIMSGSFISDRKVKALMLGTFGQITNILKGLAKKLDMSEQELFEMAKQY